jgi:hypothetical protein
VNVSASPEEVQLLREAIEAYERAFAEAVSDANWEAAARLAAFASMLSRIEEEPR